MPGSRRQCGPRCVTWQGSPARCYTAGPLGRPPRGPDRVVERPTAPMCNTSTSAPAGTPSLHGPGLPLLAEHALATVRADAKPAQQRAAEASHGGFVDDHERRGLAQPAWARDDVRGRHIRANHAGWATGRAGACGVRPPCGRLLAGSHLDEGLGHGLGHSFQRGAPRRDSAPMRWSASDGPRPEGGARARPSRPRRSRGSPSRPAGGWPRARPSWPSVAADRQPRHAPESPRDGTSPRAQSPHSRHRRSTDHAARIIRPVDSSRRRRRRSWCPEWPTSRRSARFRRRPPH